MWVIGGATTTNGTTWNCSSDVWSSSDGITWTQETANAAFGLRAAHTSVVYNNKMWVIGGMNGTSYKDDIWSSSDGVTWTQVTAAAGFSPRENHTSVVFNDKMWVIAGFNNSYLHDVWWSQ